MNLPIRLLLITGLTTLCITSFTTRSGTATSNTPSGAKQMQYYWFTMIPYEMYNDHKTIADEEYELWVLYGYNVDTSPSGGTLLAKGYFNDAYPHNQNPLVMLYGHFPFMLKSTNTQ